MDSFTSINLPTELISQICDILFHTDPPSLLNFARSSRACYTIAAAFLSRTIWIYAADPEDLIISVQGHLKRLHCLGVFGSVHRLVIYGPGVDNPSRPDSSNFPTPMPMIDLEDRFDKPLPSIYKFEESSVAKVYEVDDRWLPLVDLIQQLPALTDLIYQCPGQFPPCLLQALHQHRPGCRLHIDNFCLRSIIAKPPIADPHEFMIATSPCLYSISVAVDCFYKIAPSHHVQAVLRLVTGLAPKLKEVHLVRYEHPVPRNEDQEHSSFLPPWKNLPIFKACPGVLGSLSCLQLWSPAYYYEQEHDPVTERLLVDWSMHTDFSVLRILEINCIVDENALDNLVNGFHNFRSLETLVLTLNHKIASNSTRYNQLVEELIGNLRGLHTLEIFGWTRHIDIITKLNSKLRTLTLGSFYIEYNECYNHHLTIQDVANIRERCPLLENLGMTVYRTKGDANETALYRELGTFPKLKNLNLMMCASLPCDPDKEDMQDYDDFDREPFAWTCAWPLTWNDYLKGHIRDLFVNGAMDGTLARAIFETISQVQESHSFGSLKRLRIGYHIIRGSRQLSLGKYHIPLFGSWQVDRSPRDDSRQILFAGRLDEIDREAKERAYDLERVEISLSRSWVEQELVFRRLWPERWEGSDWWDDWHSFPLSTSS